jgi:hypothetical protein
MAPRKAAFTGIKILNSVRKIFLSNSLLHLPYTGSGLNRDNNSTFICCDDISISTEQGLNKFFVSVRKITTILALQPSRLPYAKYIGLPFAT